MRVLQIGRTVFMSSSEAAPPGTPPLMGSPYRRRKGGYEVVYCIRNTQEGALQYLQAVTQWPIFKSDYTYALHMKLLSCQYAHIHVSTGSVPPVWSHLEYPCLK